MEILRTVLYVLHMIAMVAIVLAPFVPQLGHRGQAWAARIQLLLGLGLVAVHEMGDLGELDHAKVGVKLLVAIAVVALAEIGRARAGRGQDGRTLALAAAGLTVLNAAIAYLW